MIVARERNSELQHIIESDTAEAVGAFRNARKQ